MTTMAVVAMLAVPATINAQGISLNNEEMLESLVGEKEGEEENNRYDIDPEIEIDDFAPLGEGIMLLSCLGGAYLLGKRRKE